MNARNKRGPFHIGNIVVATDCSPELVIEMLQDVIDSPDLDIPDEGISEENIRKLQSLQAYYGNQYPYLVGLWGALRCAAQRGDAQRIAMRDYLEKVVSACSKKYDVSSRILTGHQIIMQESAKAKTYSQ